MREFPADAPARSTQHGARGNACVVCSYQIAKLAGPIELEIRYGSQCRTVALGPEALAKVGQIPQRRQQHPWTKRGVLANEHTRLRLPAPHERAPVGLGPHRDDARCFIPAPEPFVLFRRHPIDRCERTTCVRSDRGILASIRSTLVRRCPLPEPPNSSLARAASRLPQECADLENKRARCYLPQLTIVDRSVHRRLS